MAPKKAKRHQSQNVDLAEARAQPDFNRGSRSQTQSSKPASPSTPGPGKPARDSRLEQKVSETRVLYSHARQILAKKEGRESHFDILKSVFQAVHQVETKRASLSSWTEGAKQIKLQRLQALREAAADIGDGGAGHWLDLITELFTIIDSVFDPATDSEAQKNERNEILERIKRNVLKFEKMSLDLRERFDSLKSSVHDVSAQFHEEWSKLQALLETIRSDSEMMKTVLSRLQGTEEAEDLVPTLMYFMHELPISQLETALGTLQKQKAEIEKERQAEIVKQQKKQAQEETEGARPTRESSSSVDSTVVGDRKTSSNALASSSVIENIPEVEIVSVGENDQQGGAQQSQCDTTPPRIPEEQNGASSKHEWSTDEMLETWTQSLPANDIDKADKADSSPDGHQASVSLRSKSAPLPSWDMQQTLHGESVAMEAAISDAHEARQNGTVPAPMHTISDGEINAIVDHGDLGDASAAEVLQLPKSWTMPNVAPQDRQYDETGDNLLHTVKDEYGAQSPVDRPKPTSPQRFAALKGSYMSRKGEDSISAVEALKQREILLKDTIAKRYTGQRPPLGHLPEVRKPLQEVVKDSKETESDSLPEVGGAHCWDDTSSLNLHEVYEEKPEHEGERPLHTDKAKNIIDPAQTDSVYPFGQSERVALPHHPPMPKDDDEDKEGGHLSQGRASPMKAVTKRKRRAHSTNTSRSPGDAQGPNEGSFHGSPAAAKRPVGVVGAAMTVPQRTPRKSSSSTEPVKAWHHPDDFVTVCHPYGISKMLKYNYPVVSLCCPDCLRKSYGMVMATASQQRWRTRQFSGTSDLTSARTSKTCPSR